MKKMLYVVSGLLAFTGLLFGMTDTFPLVAFAMVVAGLVGSMVAHEQGE
jgi:hypothetical protein